MHYSLPQCDATHDVADFVYSAGVETFWIVVSISYGMSYWRGLSLRIGCYGRTTFNVYSMLRSKSQRLYATPHHASHVSVSHYKICPFYTDYNLSVITNQPRTRPEVGYFLFGTCCGQICVFTLKSALVSYLIFIMCCILTCQGEVVLFSLCALLLTINC